MNHQNNPNLLQSKKHSFNGNEPILLNDPEIIWLVESGTVSLFAVTLKEGVTEGNRRYLFSCESGEALFGTAASLTSIDYQILAIPLGQVTLLKLDRESLRQLTSDRDFDLAALVNKWLAKFDSNLFDYRVPKIHIQATAEENYSLTKGQNLQPISDTTTIWIRVKEGIVRLLGIKELIITEHVEIFPLPQDLWIEASNDTQLATEITSSATDADALLTGISIFHQHFLFCHRLSQKQKQDKELQRLAALDSLNQQVTAEALKELVSPLTSKTDNLSLGNTPLLRAAGAVGRALGAKIRPPARSDVQREDPLKAIARASRLRLRQVLLRDDWWKQDCGPLIGYIYSETDKQPVALLPINNSSYELYNATNNTRVPIDRKLAQTVEPVAYMFYRSFADKALSAIDIFKFAFRGREKDIAIIIFASIAVTLLGMLIPQATAITIDNAIPDSDRFTL
ncbi:MAG: NHLP bacteriocin export ABC transporter permease/ATPase subunit, partial [Cyanobacteria bacterium P01_A01_bin.83]